MKVHYWTYNHCLFVSYLTRVAFGYGWISDTNFQKFLDKDWTWIFKKFIGYGSGVKISISVHLCCTSWGNLILKMQHSTTGQAKQKISVNLDNHWSKKCLFLCVHCKRIGFFHQELRDFAKMTLTWVSSHWL